MDVVGRSTLLKCRSVGTFLCFCPRMNQLVEALECCCVVLQDKKQPGKVVVAIMARCCMPIAIVLFFSGGCRGHITGLAAVRSGSLGRHGSRMGKTSSNAQCTTQS